MLSMVHLMCLSVFCILLLVAAVVDILIRQVPNHLIAGGITVWAVDAVLQSYFASAQFAIAGIIGGFAIAGIVLAAALVMDKALGKPSFGGGDVKLLFIIGLYTGLFMGLVALFIACVLSLAYCGIRALAKSPVRDFPFAPFLAVGFYVVTAYSLFVL